MLTALLFWQQGGVRQENQVDQSDFIVKTPPTEIPKISHHLNRKEILFTVFHIAHKHFALHES